MDSGRKYRARRQLKILSTTGCQCTDLVHDVNYSCKNKFCRCLLPLTTIHPLSIAGDYWCKKCIFYSVFPICEIKFHQALDYSRCSYVAGNGNWPFFMAENGNIAYISTDFGHENSDVNGKTILRGLENGNCPYDCHGHRKSWILGTNPIKLSY